MARTWLNKFDASLRDIPDEQYIQILSAVVSAAQSFRALGEIDRAAELLALAEASLPATLDELDPVRLGLRLEQSRIAQSQTNSKEALTFASDAMQLLKQAQVSDEFAVEVQLNFAGPLFAAGREIEAMDHYKQISNLVTEIQHPSPSFEDKIESPAIRLNQAMRTL